MLDAALVGAVAAWSFTYALKHDWLAASPMWGELLEDMKGEWRADAAELLRVAGGEDRPLPGPPRV